MRNKASDVALQGIEFWSNVCEEEINLGLEAEEVIMGYHFYLR